MGKKKHKTKQSKTKQKREEKNNKKIKERKREKEEEEEERKPTTSHPSVKSQRPQERWIGATRNHRGEPLPRTILSASVRITGYRRSDCRRDRRESILYARAEPAGRHNFPPKPRSNSIFKSGTGGARNFIHCYVIMTSGGNGRH